MNIFCPSNSKPKAKDSRTVLFFIALTIGGIFLLDWITPLGYAEWLLYVVPMLLAIKLARRRYGYYIAALCTLLIVAGFFLSPSGIIASVAIFNRTLGICILWVLAIYQDKSKHAKDLLEESYKRFSTLVMASSKVVYQMSADWSEMRQLHAQGFIADTEKPNRNWLQEYIHPDDQLHVKEAISESIRTKSIFELEHRVLRVDGTLGWTFSRAIPILDADGKIIEWFGAASDITARKMAEAELEANIQKLQIETAERLKAVETLREKEQLLIHQGRLAAMGEMIGNIAHQWRQPLNSLGLVIQQLLLLYDKGGLTKEVLTKNVGTSQELIKHMSKTIDDFRNFFRPDKEKVAFKVSESVASTLLLVEDSFKKQNINIVIVAKNDPVIRGYKNEYAQVLLNILNNARDALTERESQDRMVTITICAEESLSVLTVADNAGGIPEEIMDKIFDPYFTTKGPQQGTGVGLFMSKTIIEKNMGGRLSARNTTDGAEFRIEV